MPLRMAVTKVSGQGEQIVIDVSQWNGVTGEMMHDIAEMSALFNNAMDIADLRLFEMNNRMIEAYNFREYFKPEDWQKVAAILDILAGRADAQTVKQRIESAIEETRELEEMREAAYQEKQAAIAEALESVKNGQY